MFQLASYLYQGKFAVSAAAMRIGDVTIPRTPNTTPIMIGSIAVVPTGQITIPYDIYSQESDFANGIAPLESGSVTFADYPAIEPDLAASTLYTSYFGGMVTPPAGEAAPTNQLDAFVMQAYNALPNHPDLTTLLTGATRI